MGKNRNKRKNYGVNGYAIIVFCAILIVLAFIKIFSSFVSLEKKDFHSYLIVSDHGGFDLNNTALTFGMVAPGGSATRGLIVENGYNFPIKVEILPKGEIAKFVRKQKVILTENEKKEIGISAYAPKGTNYGNYTGTISVVIKKYLLKY